DCGREQIAIGLGECVLDQLVPDDPLIDEAVQRIAIELLHFWFRDEAVKTDAACCGRLILGTSLPRRWFGQAGALELKLGGDGNKSVEGLAPEKLVDAFAVCFDRSGGYEFVRS